MEKKLFFGNNVEHKDNNSETLNLKIKDFLKNREMYNIPGFFNITERDVKQYIETNKGLEKKLPHIIQENLEDKNWYIRSEAAKMIPYAPESEQDFLREKCLEIILKDFKDKKNCIREIAIKMILYVSELKQDFLREKCLEILKYFENEKPFVHIGIVEIIPYVPAEKRAGLIQKVYEEAEKDTYILEQIIKKIPYVPAEKRAGLIRMFLKNKNSFIRQIVIQKIPLALEGEREHLFQEALLNEDSDNREIVKKMIQHILEEKETEKKIETKDQTKYEKKREKERKKDPLIQELAGQSSLYKDWNDKSGFKGFKDFLKTGSRITLLDEILGQSAETLRGKTIIRHIPLKTYFFWKKAYEAYEHWKKMGFDYVPVEPIIKVSYLKSASEQTEERKYWKEKGLDYIPIESTIKTPYLKLSNEIDVYTRVINGPSVETWKNNNGTYQLEIEKQIRKIEKGLKEIGVEHGHLHEGNFVLLFPRNEDGTVDLSYPPRAYAIDFDMATSK